MSELRVFDIPQLSPIPAFYYANSICVKDYYDKNYIKGMNEEDMDSLVWEAVEFYSAESELQYVSIMAARYAAKITKKTKTADALVKADSRKFWLITFTSDPDKTEDQNRLDITRYRQAHFKKYKYVYTEERDSADSKKYHQHILIECPLKVVHTKQNLKPAAYYKGNINNQKVSPTRSSIDNIIYYLNKETPAKGDVDYFLNLQF